MRCNFSEQFGRSMIEMIGVLAIIGVLSVGGFAMYSKSIAKHKYNRAADQISTLLNKINVIYSNKSNYANISASKIVGYGIVDSDMVITVNNKKAIKNIYGGRIYFYNGPTNDSFWITIDGLPSAACVALASMDWGNNCLKVNASNLSTIGIMASGATANPGKTAVASRANNSLPMSPATAASVCTGKSNFVAFQFQ